MPFQTQVFGIVAPYIQYVIIAVGILILLAIFVEIKNIVNKHKEKSKKEEYEKGLNWVNLELKIPTDNLKSPQAMEQVFASLHAIPKEDWVSFEIAGFSQDTHFYIRVPSHLSKLLEASVFSQYPGAEITPAEDYVSRFGRELPDDDYDVAGSELVLERNNAYPLRTYPSFGEGNKEDEHYTDPISTVTEVMSGLKNDEMIWLQIIVRPLDKGKNDKWKKETQGVLDELLGRKEKEKGVDVGEMVISVIKFFTIDLVKALFEHPKTEEPKKPDKPSRSLSPMENDTVRAIENKLGKFPFECAVRVLYIDRRSTFAKSSMSAIVGAFRQFGSPQLNSFKLDEKQLTFIEKNFKKEETELAAKKSLFKAYVGRSFSSSPIVLSTEELATMYHPPHASVGAEKLTRLEMKRGTPPTNLPQVTE